MAFGKGIMAIATAGGLAVLGFGAGPVTHVFAGLGPSQECQDDGNDVAILGGPASQVPGAPITLGIELGALNPNTGQAFEPGFVELCFSDTPYGVPGSVGTGIHVRLGGPTVGSGSTDLAEVDCSNDTSDSVTVTCPTTADPTLVPTPGPCGTFLCGGTATLSMPYSTCLGSSLTGASCTSGAQGLGSTGLIVAGLAVGPPPQGTASGASVTVTTLQVWVDGIQVPIAGGTGGVGANVAAVNDGTGGTGPAGTGVWVGTQTGVPAMALQIGQTVIPVTIPGPNCLSLFTSCPAPY